MPDPKNSPRASICRIRPATICAIFLSLFFMLLQLPLTVDAQPATKRVLILTSSDPYHPGFSVLTKAIITVIRSWRSARVEFLYELQESLKVPPKDPAEDAKTLAYLRQKYDGQKIDLMLLLVAPRFRALLRDNPEVFKDVPKVVYDFEEERDPTLRELGPHVTGIWAKVDLTDTLDVAFNCHPGVGKVLVAAGNGNPDQMLLQQAQSEFRKYEGKATFVYLTNLTLDEMKSKLAGLPKDCFVIFLTFSADRYGNRYAGPDSIAAVAPASGAPVYGISDRYLGLGIVGGSLVDFPSIGKRIGDVTLRILSGEKAGDIPSETVPNVAIFDWRELQRWGINERNLPQGSLIQFKEPSLWEAYKWYIIGLIAAVLIEAMMIAGLLFLRARSRRAEAENARLACLTDEAHRKLGELVSNVPGIVWERRLDATTKELRTTFISDYLQKMLGYTPEEWLMQPAGFELQLIPAEDRERVTRDYETVVATGKDGFTQFRWKTKDGGVVWVESHLSAILDQNGRVTGIRSVTLDVSGRKEAEETLRETEEKSSAIVAAIPDSIFLQTSDGVFLDYHATNAPGLFGTPEEFLGKNMREVLPQALAADFQRSFQLASETHVPQIVECKLGVSEGEKWIEARIVRTGDKFLSVVRDITERKEAERALHQANVELSKLKNQLEAENIYLQEELRQDQAFGDIIGQSAAIKYVLYKVSQVAQMDTTVLILGETGTGKELVARAIHDASQRKDRPLIKVNCAALSPTLIETELFGHEKGAFTGAAARKVGRFELADTGTLLLDEIGELPMDLQGKLLRVLQEGEFERVGSSTTNKVDVRIIASTNKELKLEVNQGRFREDLWYRLNVFPITTPPLRDRRDDIPILTDNFARQFSRKFGKQIAAVSPNTMTELCRYSWPGNVRELANVIERAVINSRGRVLELQDDFSRLEAETLADSVKTLEAMERDYIIKILEDLSWRIDGPRGAARVLAINPSTLRTRMAKLGIQKPTANRSAAPY